MTLGFAGQGSVRSSIVVVEHSRTARIGITDATIGHDARHGQTHSIIAAFRGGKAMGWLPTLQLGTFELRDAANLLVGTLGAVLAWRSITLGKRQEDISKRQEQMTMEQGAIAKRQEQIANTQFEIQQAELKKRSKLTMLIAAESDIDTTTYRVAIKNNGDKTADGCFSILTYPKSIEDQISLKFAEGTVETTVRMSEKSHPSGFDWMSAERFVSVRLYPGTDTIVARFTLSPGFDRRRFSMFGCVIWEDGHFPEKEAATPLSLPG